MKVDTVKLKKGSSELTAECRELIDELTKRRTRAELLEFLDTVHVWIYGKCELYHWIEILDRFDKILEEAARHVNANEFVLQCDTNFQDMDVTLLLHVLNFTTLLIEHSFSRHLYNSIEHLTQLLSSQNMDIVLAVLNLLYMFSKRSNFIPRLPFEKKELLIVKLFNIAERWGDPNYGLSLKDCCIGEPKLEFLYQLCIDYVDEHGHAAQLEIPDMMDLCHTAAAPEVIKTIAGQISKPSEAIKMRIAHRVRLISGFNNYKLRLQFVQARLQAVSILIYSNALQDNTDKVLYAGFGEELCELIDKEDVHLVEIRAAVLRTLTSMLHFDRNPNVPSRAGSRLMKIVHYTGAERQGGTLPLLVRDCIDNLTTHGLTERYPLILATSLFSLLYHLASYEMGGSALVKSGMMQSLLCVISWPGVDLEHITFVTRAVRVIDLITNIDIARFHQNNGLNVFIDRLEKEIKSCCKALADIGITLKESTLRDDNKLDTSLDQVDEDVEDGAGENASIASGSGSPRPDNSSDARGADLGAGPLNIVGAPSNVGGESGPPGPNNRYGYILPMYPTNSYYARPLAERKAELSSQLPSSLQPKKPSCVTQRAALLKSMLNFLKKSIQDHAHFSNMRNIMETSLTQSLRHIIANAEYYGPSLFLLATDVVTVYVFNEPSLLSSLQDLGITSVMLKALLQKDVPATREVLGSLPNVFSALCLNERGLFEFLSYDPFDKVLKVLLSPDYLVAMRRRRSSDPLGDTATNLGNAMDDLIKHHPYLREDATDAIVRLLNELVRLGSDPSFICWRANKESGGSGSGSGSHGAAHHVASAPSPMVMVAGAGVNVSVLQGAADTNDSSGEDDDDDDEMSSASQQQQQPTTTTSGQVTATTPRTQQQQAMGAAATGGVGAGAGTAASSSQAVKVVTPPEREAIPLIDYILNVMKFIEAIFSNSPNGDHCRHFVLHGGLKPILQLLSLPNLPVDSPVSTTSQAVANVCKAILTQAQETKVLDVALKQLADIVAQLKPLIKHFTFPGGSVLLAELVCCQRLEDGFANAEYTPILHNMSFVHGYVVMLVHLCRNASNEMRTILLKRWGVNRETGVQLLQQLVQLYISLVWESTILLNLCSDEPTQHPDLIWDEIAAQMSAAAGTSDPLTEAELSRKLERAAEFRTKYTPEEQFRYIKSLLAASSRLGRALAELLGTLVKLSVGSPQTRQRRINDLISNINKVPTPEAREIARILSSILVNGFSHESILPKPVPKLKLTFLICSVGFTGPMLFDDKRSAFHLMISQFCAENGLKAFFEMFYWALSLDNVSQKFEFDQWASMEDLMQSHEDDKRDCPEGTGEFLDAWLQLLEKMVNPRAMLDSPYTMSPRLNYLPDSVPFEPVFYLIHIHQLAMQALRRIWARRPIPNYGPSMFETMILILKHLIKSHQTLLDRYHTRMKEIRFENLYIRSSDEGLNADHIKMLTDMGFMHYHVIEALRSNTSLEEATDYLLNNPETSALWQSGSNNAPGGGSAAAGASAPPPPPPLPPTAGSGATMDVDMEMDGSGGGAAGASGETAPGGTNASSSSSSYDYKHLKLMPSMIFDRFCDEAISRAFEFMEAIPDTVNSAADLIAVLYRRHNHLNKQVFVTNFVRNIIQWVDFTLQLFEPDKSNTNSGVKATRLDECLTGVTATRLFVRLKTSTLLLEENYSDMHRPLVEAITAQDAMVSLVKLLDCMSQWMLEQAGETRPVVPRWVQNLVDLIDAIDSISHILQRKANMRAVSSDVWRWYDASTGKWNAYSEANNELIRNAYAAGERWLHINIGRQRCTVSLNCMTQVSEASGTHRPVFPALKLSEAIGFMNNPVVLPRADNFLNRIVRTSPDGTGTVHTDELIPLRQLVNFNDGQPPDNTASNEAESGGGGEGSGGGGTAAAASASASASAASTASEDNPAAGASGGSPPPAMTTRSKSRQKNAAAAAAAAKVKSSSSQAAGGSPPIPKRTQKIILNEEQVGLSKFDCGRIIGSIVDLLKPTNLLHNETKLSLLRLCARLTRNYDNAQVFIRRGGVRMLLHLQQACSFMGFPTYAIIILRHVLEAPPVLQEAMERVLGMRAAGIVPVGHRDLIYVLTQVSTAVSRNPQIFVAAAKEMLKGEYLLNSSSSTLTDDARVMVKSKFGQQPTAAAGGATPQTQTPPPSKSDDELKDDPQVQSSVAVLKDLLHGLVQPCWHYGGTASTDRGHGAAELVQPDQPPGTAPQGCHDDEARPETSTNQATNKKQSASGGATGNAQATSDKFEPCCCTWHIPTSAHSHAKPTISRATLLKLLADATRAYQSLVPRVLLSHIYTPADSPLISAPQQTFLGVLLDRFLPLTQRHHVPEVSTMTRVLVCSLSDCYQQPGVQVQVAEELHAAVARALAQPDSSEKHTRLQVLMSLFPNLIESPMLYDKVHMHRNNMYRVLLRQGVMTYLTKVAQYKDLSNHNTLSTLAAILRPMEILLRFSVSTTTLGSKRILFGGSAPGSGTNGTGSSNSSNAAGGGSGTGPGSLNTYGAIINRRLYPRLAARAALNAERSNAGEHVLRDIIRNVLTDRRHAFEFIFNSDEMAVDAEDTTAGGAAAAAAAAGMVGGSGTGGGGGASGTGSGGGVTAAVIDVVEERSNGGDTNDPPANVGSAAGGGQSGSGNTGPVRPVLNFDQLWDDFLQSEGLRLASRAIGSNGSGSGAGGGGGSGTGSSGAQQNGSNAVGSGGGSGNGGNATNSGNNSVNVDPRLRTNPDVDVDGNGGVAGTNNSSSVNDNGIGGGGGSDGASTSSDQGLLRELGASLLGDVSTTDSDSDASTENDERNEEEEDEDDDAPDEDVDEHSETDVDEERPFIEVFDHIYEPESSETASNDADVDADDDDDEDEEDVDDDDDDDDDGDDEDREERQSLIDAELEDQIDFAIALTTSSQRPRRSAAVNASGDGSANRTNPGNDEVDDEDDEDDDDADNDPDNDPEADAARAATAAEEEAYLYDHLVGESDLMPTSADNFRVRMNRTIAQIAQPLDIDVVGGSGGGSGGNGGSGGVGSGVTGSSSNSGGGGGFSLRGFSMRNQSGGSTSTALRPSSSSWMAPDFNFLGVSLGASGSSGGPGASGSGAGGSGSGTANGGEVNAFLTPSLVQGVASGSGQSMSNLLDEQPGVGVPRPGDGNGTGAAAANSGPGNSTGGGASGSGANAAAQHPNATLCTNGVRRRLLYLDQQYCVCMPTHQNPTEETQMETFTQDALHWWLEEAKALDMESQTDACLYAAHFLLPHLIKELKVAHQQRKQEEAARQAAAASATPPATTTAAAAGVTPATGPAPASAVATPASGGGTTTTSFIGSSLLSSGAGGNSSLVVPPVAASATGGTRRSSIPVLIPSNFGANNSTTASQPAAGGGAAAAGASGSGDGATTNSPFLQLPTTTSNNSSSSPGGAAAESQSSTTATRGHRRGRPGAPSIFNIYAEIDLTNETDSQGATSTNPTPASGATASADAGGAEAQVSQNFFTNSSASAPNQRLPLVLPSPTSGRPLRPYSRLDDAELLLMQTSRSRPVNHSLYPSSRHSGGARPNRDLPARLQRLVQAHSGIVVPRNTSPGLTLLSTPQAMAALGQQLGQTPAENRNNFGLPSSLEVDVMPGILGMPLHEAHPEDEVVVQIEPQILPPPPPPVSGDSAAAVLIDDDDDEEDEDEDGDEGLEALARWMPRSASEGASATSNIREAWFGLNPREMATETSSQTEEGTESSPAATAPEAEPTSGETGGAASGTESAEGTDTSTGTGGASATGGAAAGGGGGGTGATITDMSPEVRAALGDLEVPEGVDPSFLAALPSEMREEVIQEHLRMQRIRQRAQQNAIQIAHDSLVEVNPEFLAALPLNIQSEVLMQQRIEQQRQAAQSANPEDPVDTAAFFQNLPENLRQAILTDMEESQIASLPPELAAEAQFLRRDWESRNGARMDAHPPSNALTRFQTTLQSLEEARWHSSIWYDASGNAQPQHHQHTTIVHHHPHPHQLAPMGKPLALLMMEDENILLDPDSLATLLLFLFVEDQKVYSMRLHRVIRNLCHHEPTRDWIINALISIVQKTNEDNANFGTAGGQAGSKPEWLKLRVDAAFGYKSNIFLINRLYEGSARSISINPQAAQMIVRNCLDLLFVLAKHYPTSFVPYNREVKTRRILSAVLGLPPNTVMGAAGTGPGSGAVGMPWPAAGGAGSGGAAPRLDESVPPGGTLDFRSRFCRYQVANRLRGMLDDQPTSNQSSSSLSKPATPLDEAPSTSKAAAAKAAASAKVSSGSGSQQSVPYQTNAKNFWDVVLNIDRQTQVRMSHVSQFPLTSQPPWEWQTNTSDFLSFSDSPFGQLLEMLPYKVICRSPHLTDMLVKLLASLSTELPKEEEWLAEQMPPLIPIGQATGPGAAASAPASELATTGANPASEIGDGLATNSTEQATPAAGNPASGDGNDGVKPAAQQQQQQQQQLPPLSVPMPMQPSKPRRKIYAKNFSQLQLVIEVLTHQCGTTEGLDNVAKLIVNLTQCSQASNAIFIQYLTAAILGLAEEVRQAIQTLLNEIRAYNSHHGVASTSQQASASVSTSSTAAGSAAPSGSLGSSGSSSGASLLPNLAVNEGIMQDRFTAEHVIISAPKNAKPTCELQLPSMKKLMSNSSAQPYFLRTLKIFMQVRDMYDSPDSLPTVSGNSAPSVRRTLGSGGHDDDDFIDILGDPPTGSSIWATDSVSTGSSPPPLSGFSMDTNHHQQPVQQVNIQDVEDEEGDDDEEYLDVDEALESEHRARINNEGAAAGAKATANSNSNKPTLSQILCLDVLWHTLSECLVALEESKDEFAVLVLQPTVEAFFLIHASHRNAVKKPRIGGSIVLGLRSLAGPNGRALAAEMAAAAASAAAQRQRDQSTPPPMDDTSSANTSYEDEPRMLDASTNTTNQTGANSNSAGSSASGTSATASASNALSAHEAQLRQDRQKFLQFAEKHRTVLNQILRQSPTHLSDGPFAVLVDHTRILDFDVKRKYFQTELERLDEGIRREEHTVSVRRVTVFEDSFRVLYRLGPEEWKNRFYIVFEDEEGQDAGGLLREWYVIISREIFNPMYALFCVSPGDRVTYMINPSSHANPNHLSYFKFVGRVIAKAVHDNKLLECYFTRSFYKHILGKQVKHTDMESQDYEFYKGLDYLMKNDISTLGYELTFSTEVQEFGVTQIRDLKPNGRDIAVTEENKFEYVQLVCQLKMSGSIRQQLDAFLEGFYDIIPKHLISIFNEQELELLISGLPDIDIEDLKANTEYHKYTSKSAQIQWFWRALRSFDQADRAKFLQFVTGTSKVPLQGFGSLEGMNGIQKFQIHRDDRSTDRLPCAHTCFNQLDLPMYKSYDKLRSCLLKAIHECSEGFGFA
ncbi:E3 ubiquitin-protein ligase HUWE1 isoform X3 [Drosophila serrata]|uniref:E3 ubiquitin-protein ligase HUWE1 isoform X3 n=1 Tax=Drosophila serrata TaxID=7274 RepID=UPI000A1D0F95|nr:E3 ubiquitin-protein ligase HUWE1 isoform X3 [Drosophila serrata]